MTNKENISDNLKETAPKLASINKEESPFKVPDNYFSTLPEKVRSKTVDLENGKTSLWDVLLQYRLRPQLAVTIIIVIGAFGYWFYNTNYSDDITPDYTAIAGNISDEDIEKYIALNLDTFDDQMLGEYVSLMNGNDYTEESEFDKELEEYILNNIDENLIMEELLL
ncbi:MAG: hypothetical protein COA57_13970 [Flavobacteriales bacterium]|nr:MAG: hypothetical protein COA57_13970 [Flavobacteriales bacterium]